MDSALSSVSTILCSPNLAYDLQWRASLPRVLEEEAEEEVAAAKEDAAEDAAERDLVAVVGRLRNTGMYREDERYQ